MGHCSQIKLVDLNDPYCVGWSQCLLGDAYGEVKKGKEKKSYIACLEGNCVVGLK